MDVGACGGDWLLVVLASGFPRRPTKHTHRHTDRQTYAQYTDTDGQIIFTALYTVRASQCGPEAEAGTASGLNNR